MSRNTISDFKLVSTSGLIFSQLCLGYSADDSKEIQEVIDDRLLKQYRINKEKSFELIKNDITVINKRGSVLIDYAFCTVTHRNHFPSFGLDKESKLQKETCKRP